LILLRGLAAIVYRSAVLKVLRRGRVTRQELHPVLTAWFERLDCWPDRAPPSSSFAQAARFTARWPFRFALFVLLTLTWVLFTAQGYVGEFFNYHPYIGFMNHPLVQIPSVDYIPKHLQD